METRESQATPRSGEKDPLLPLPEEIPAGQWADKAKRAQEARALGRKLRRGKRLLFSSVHHLAS
jgi:hypothetical protein